MVFAEAQAVGTPVVSFSHGAIPEVVDHGHTGLLCPEANVPALAESLEKLLLDDQLWSSLSRRAREWVMERFDINKQTESLEALYDECVANHRSSRSAQAELDEWGLVRRNALGA